MKKARAILARSSPDEDGPGSGKKNLQVEPDRPVLAITQIQPHHFVKPRPVAPAHLPQARYARSYFQNSSPVPDIVNFKLVRNWRPGANQRHIPAQHVPELRKLIHTC